MLRRTPEPFFVPEADFEVAGFVPNVVFPTGVVQDGETLLVYYGAADACHGGRRVLASGSCSAR